MTIKVVLGWQPSTVHGWGVYGVNLALEWSKDPTVTAATAYPPVPNMLSLDPIRTRALSRFMAQTAELTTNLARFSGKSAKLDAALLHGLGNDLVEPPTPDGVQLSGRHEIGVIFFEHAALSSESLKRAERYEVIVAGSHWNERLLRAQGVSRVVTILQGVDPTLFRPAPAARVLGDRFLVFSGGKLEVRKGQDLVLKAFSQFASRHPDAILAAAWHSPWPDLVKQMGSRGLIAPPAFDARGKLDLPATAEANGIPRSQFIDLGYTPNPMMPALLREMDVAVFPNRAEGGTNLVAMECMACGTPTIMSANTGHLDLIEDDNCYPLLQQQPLEGEGQGVGGEPGWGESSVDEIVEALERAYADRADARRRGQRGAEKLAGLTWAKTAQAMTELLRQL